MRRRMRLRAGGACVRTFSAPIFALMALTSSVVISPTVVTLPSVIFHRRNGPVMSPYLSKADRADDAFIADRLAVLDQAERLGELVLAGMDRLAVGSTTLRIASLIAAGSALPAWRWRGRRWRRHHRSGRPPGCVGSMPPENAL